jgi:hypothetical protein
MIAAQGHFMNTLRNMAEFRSRRFTPVLPEQAQVNPGVYGAELAYWLSTELARLGVVTSYPIAEDWGWLIEYSTAGGATFAVHCGNVDGTDDRWLLSLRRFRRGFLGRDKPSYEEARPLVDAIERLLRAEASVTELHWLYEA